MAGVEVLRRIAAEGEPPVSVRLVNWADEEGARFEAVALRLFAAAGSMRDQDELRKLVDRDGVSLPEAVGKYGVDLDRAHESRSQLAGAAAYLELHIEQGPVLESLDLPLGLSSAHSGSSGRGSPGAARRRMQARRRWTSAAMRSPGR